MSDFTAVSTGNKTFAADINQLINALNGVSTVGLIVLGGNAARVPYTGQLSATPAADADVVAALVTGDAAARLSAYLRSADGYGGIRGGVGATPTAHMYAQASGWVIPESLTVQGTTNIATAKQSAGTQITRRCGWRFYHNDTSVAYHLEVSFPFEMTNVPSSITLTSPTFTEKVNTLSAGSIDIYGFTLNLSPTAPDTCAWQGRYITVGNCLRAVSMSARVRGAPVGQLGTFDHHCSGFLADGTPCDRYARGLSPHRDLRVEPLEETLCGDPMRPGLYALSYVCPRCGSVESWHTGYRAEDESGPRRADINAPHKQAQLIRRLQRVLDLPRMDP